MDIEYLNEAPIPIILTNHDGEILFANISASLMLQRTKETLIKQNLQSFIWKDDQETLHSMLLDPELHPSNSCTFCNSKQELIMVHLTVSKISLGYLWYIENREEYNTLQKELKLKELHLLVNIEAVE